MSDEEIILVAIHQRSEMWKSDRCKRSSLEDALERKLNRHGYGITDAHAKIEALIAAGKLKEENGFILDQFYREPDDVGKFSCKL